MSGGGGAASSKAEDTNSMTTYNPWFNELNKNQGNVLNQQANAIPGLTNQIMAGGSAPVGGVWNGGQTSNAMQPVQPAQNAMAGVPMKSGLS